MRKLIVHMSNSAAIGMDAYDALLVEDNATNEDIDDAAFEMAIDHASSFFDVENNDFDGVDYIDCDEEGNDVTNDMQWGVDYILEADVEASWKDYNGEDHDNYRAGGGSFEDDFAELAR